MSWHELADLEERMDVNILREELECEPLRPATRKCLRCDQEFHSFGYQNRICYDCSMINMSMDADFAEAVSGITLEEFIAAITDSEKSKLPLGWSII